MSIVENGLELFAYLPGEANIVTLTSAHSLDLPSFDESILVNLGDHDCYIVRKSDVSKGSLVSFLTTPALHHSCN
jgi:hypothetical protein